MYLRPDTQFQPSGPALSATWPLDRWPTPRESWAVSPLLPPREWVKSRRGNVTNTREALIRVWQSDVAGIPHLIRARSVARTYLEEAYGKAKLLMAKDDTLEKEYRDIFARILAGQRVNKDNYTEALLQQICDNIGQSDTYQRLVILYGDQSFLLPNKPDLESY